MIRIVVDTNIQISALGWIGKPHTLIKKCMKKELTLITSLDLIEEFKKVATRPKFGFTTEEIDGYINAQLEVAELVQPTEKLDVVKDDPDDNKFIECAVEGNANYIVTGDKHLLKLGKYKDIEIISVAEFLEKIK
ncbi:MAG: putative toxin-antitoxin system toxin component, PIN family [Methanosarcinales archaeon]